MLRKFALGTIASVCLSTAAIAASPYKITKTIPMPNGDWDYSTSDLAKGVIYFVRSDHTDVIDTKTNKISTLKTRATAIWPSLCRARR